MSSTLATSAAPWMEIQNRISEIQARFGSNRTQGLGDFGSFSSVLAASAVKGSESGSVGANVLGNFDGLTPGEQVVELAKQHLGTPYVWGGESPSGGFDCSGLVQYVFGQMGVELPRVSRDQARAGQPVASLADARPGDLLAFNDPVDHIGIYAGDNMMVVAPKRGDVVKLQRVTASPTAIRRVLPDDGEFGVVGTSGANEYFSTSFDDLFAAAGEQYDISPRLLAAVAKAESGLNPRAVSKAGAQGLMQLMPSTARGLGVDPFSPAEAIDGAARLLSSYMAEFGSVELALGAYNAGPATITRYGGVPPYHETQAYIRRVMALMEGVSS